jgi:hypothetical protein
MYSSPNGKMNNQTIIRTRIRNSAIISLVLFTLWTLITSSGYDRKSSWDDIGLWMIIAIGIFIFTVVNLVLLIVLSKKPQRSTNPVIIFLSVHSMIWGTAYLVLCIVMSIEGEIVPFLLLPVITGGFTFRKIYLFSSKKD